jgi:hypothetical protein
MGSAVSSTEPFAVMTPREAPLVKPIAANHDKLRDSLAQARYIAIAFALALVGAIYLARTNRQSGVPQVARSESHIPSLEAEKDSAPLKPSVTRVIEWQATVPTDGAFTNLPAVFVDRSPPGTNIQTELRSATIPQIAWQSATDNNPRAAQEFSQWTKEPDDSAIARPQAPSEVANQTLMPTSTTQIAIAKSPALGERALREREAIKRWVQW